MRQHLCKDGKFGIGFFEGSNAIVFHTYLVVVVQDIVQKLVRDLVIILKDGHSTLWKHFGWRCPLLRATCIALLRFYCSGGLPRLKIIKVLSISFLFGFAGLCRLFDYRKEVM